jgi:hypothetical protein
MPSYVRVKGSNWQEIPEYIHQGSTTTVVPNGVTDVCDFSYTKPIITQTPNYNINAGPDPCQWLFDAYAEGPALVSGVTLNWSATDSNTGLIVTGNEQYFDYLEIIPTDPGIVGFVTLLLEIQTECGHIEKTKVVPYQTCNSPGGIRQLVISPNPATNQVYVRVVQNNGTDFVTNDPHGIRIRIYPNSGNTNAMVNSYLYNNGQIFNLSTLPTGVYQMIASASDLAPVRSNFSIVR